MKKAVKERVYVCHTYYHVYISLLKELNLPKRQRGKADLVLSRMSTDFESLKQRIETVGIFDNVVEYDEKPAEFFPELAPLKANKGNIAANMISRIRFTKRFAALQAAYIPVDFKAYRDIYVYCDSDPIGYYLNQNRIPYHALEDGLNCLKNYDAARYDNRGCFGLKAFMSERLNLIFIQNGYGKYCIDMEVNDISLLKYKYRKYKEVPRQKLADALREEDKPILLKVFVRDMEELERQIQESSGVKDKILVLTDPLCTLDVRKKIFRDIIETYQKEGTVFLKPHPRDELDYRREFPDIPQFDAAMPMEVLNFFSDIRFKKVVAVLTEIKAIRYGDEMVRLGESFMDKYEDPLIHRQNEQI